MRRPLGGGVEWRCDTDAAIDVTGDIFIYVGKIGAHCT